MLGGTISSRFLVPHDPFLVFLTVHLTHVVAIPSMRSFSWGAVRKTASEKVLEKRGRLFFALHLN